MMGLSAIQCLCCVLMGAIFAVWMDDEESRRLSTEALVVCDAGYGSAAVYANFDQGVVRLESNQSTEYGDDLDDYDNDDENDKNSTSWQPSSITSSNKSGLENIADHNNKTASKYSPILNYLRDPERFIRTVQDCATDPRCHIMYQHVSKT